jgi:hypothetical protein
MNARRLTRPTALAFVLAAAIISGSSIGGG